MVELPFCVVGGPKGHKHIIWVGGPQGLKHTTWTRIREKIVLEITMGNCKMNYGKDKKEKKEKRQIKKK